MKTHCRSKRNAVPLSVNIMLSPRAVNTGKHTSHTHTRESNQLTHVPAVHTYNVHPSNPKTRPLQDRTAVLQGFKGA